MLYAYFAWWVYVLWKVKVWRFDPDSPNSSKFPLAKVSGFMVIATCDAQQKYCILAVFMKYNIICLRGCDG